LIPLLLLLALLAEFIIPSKALLTQSRALVPQ